MSAGLASRRFDLGAPKSARASRPARRGLLHFGVARRRLPSPAGLVPRALASRTPLGPRRARAAIRCRAPSPARAPPRRATRAWRSRAPARARRRRRCTGTPRPRGTTSRSARRAAGSTVGAVGEARASSVKLSDAMATGSPSSTPTRHTWSGSGAHRSTRYLATRARGRSSGVPLNASSITSATRRTSSPRSARTVTAPPPETGMSARSNALCSARRASAVARADAAARRARRVEAVCGVRAGSAIARSNAPERRSHQPRVREGRRRRTRPRGTSFATMYHRRAPCGCPRVPGVPARLASPDANVDVRYLRCG